MKISVKKTGNMAFTAHTESGHEIKMDSAPAFGGDNSGARPMELLLTGLGGCTSIDVIHILNKLRQNVSDCQVEVTGQRAETEPKVFTQIHVHFTITGEQLEPKKVERAIQLSAEKYCSASIMLGAMAEITHDYTIIDV